jgi:hypothetical protein
MTALRMIELVAAVLLLGAGVWLYRRPAPATDDGGGSYGNQGAVILLVVAAILAIYALGGLDYHPSQSELDYLKSQRQ